MQSQHQQSPSGPSSPIRQQQPQVNTMGEFQQQIPSEPSDISVPQTVSDVTNSQLSSVTSSLNSADSSSVSNASTVQEIDPNERPPVEGSVTSH